MPEKSIWNQISNPRETYTDGYGITRYVNEPAWVRFARKGYNILDRFLNGSKEFKNGINPPSTSAGILDLMDPSSARRFIKIGSTLKEAEAAARAVKEARS